MPSPADHSPTFADLLAHHRTASGLSQEQLAAAASLSVRAIRDLERGAVRRPQHASVVALAGGLGLTGAVRDAFVAAARQSPPKPNRRRPAESTSLPEPTTTLIGRDADIDGVATLLRQPTTRLVSVTGWAGVGTSAVALEAARRVVERFDETRVLDLARVVDPAEVGSAVAATLGSKSPVRRSLVLLDGFRHGDAAALGLADLLARHRRLHFLLTAHTPVRLRGEHVWPLAPLSAAAAAALLAERANAVRAGFTLDSGNEAIVASLCRRLAGVPRAIELAALRLRTRDLVELDAELARDLAANAGRPEQLVRRMVAAAVTALPAREAEILAALAAVPPGVTPAFLRDLVRADLTGEQVDMAVAALAALGLITADDRSGQVYLGAVDAVGSILAERSASAESRQRLRQDTVG